MNTQVTRPGHMLPCWEQGFLTPETDRVLSDAYWDNSTERQRVNTLMDKEEATDRQLIRLAWAMVAGSVLSGIIWAALVIVLG